MSRKYIIWVVAGAAVVLILSIIAGINIGKSPATYEATPTPYPVSPIEQASIQTTVPLKEEKYTIRLEGSSLILYDGEKKLNETEITPHVLPSSDIEALKSGLSYSSLENALVDWESLCK